MTEPEIVVRQYAADVVSGRIPAGKWIYAACSRFNRDLERTDIVLEWNRVADAFEFIGGLSLVGEADGEPFKLHPWQAFIVANLVGWRTAEGRRRFTMGIIQVARGNGKTTLMAALGLYDFMSGAGKRVHVLANKVEQAQILVDTARTMARRLDDPSVKVKMSDLTRPDEDCEFNALTSRESSLDGLNPSLWIADEAAEYRGSVLNKLITTGMKRKETLGVIISTPGSNTESHYETLCSGARAVLSGEAEDDATFAMLYGIDQNDDIADEAAWPKANPGMQYGQPDAASIRRLYNTMKRDPGQRSEFCRYHCARLNEDVGGWLDMSYWPAPTVVDWEAQIKRQAWVGIDLSKSLDMSAVVVAIPQDNGNILLRGHYWWPRANVAQRELDYRMPIRRYADEGKINLTPGADIDHEAIAQKVLKIMKEFNVQLVGYDRWGASYLAQRLAESKDGAPIQAYSMGSSTFAPGCQLFQNLWVGRKFIIGDDPILRRACAEAIPKTGMTGYVRPQKPRDHSAIDPLVAAIMAVHCWGGKKASCYELEI